MTKAEEIAKKWDVYYLPSGEINMDVLEAINEALRIHDVISCVCPNEIKTGTVSIDCCNICGKPDEEWWVKH